MSSTLQRSVSAASPLGTPRGLPNLPVIEHPLSRLGDSNDLTIRGSSTYGRTGGLQRSQTDVGFKTASGPNRILNWPPGKFGTVVRTDCIMISTSACSI